MPVHIRYDVARIKTGWSASSPDFRVTAHGRTKAIAGLNLERTLTMFLEPFRRNGTIQAELASLGVRQEGEDTTVVLHGTDV